MEVSVLQNQQYTFGVRKYIVLCIRHSEAYLQMGQNVWTNLDNMLIKWNN